MVDPAGAQPWWDLCPQPQQDPAPCLRAGEWEAGEKPSHSEDSGAAQGSLASQLRPGHSTAPSHWLLGDLRAQVGHCPGEGQVHSAGLRHTSAPMTQRLSVQAVTLPAVRRPKAPPKEPATQKGPQGGAWSTGTSPAPRCTIEGHQQAVPDPGPLADSAALTSPEPCPGTVGVCPGPLRPGSTLPPPPQWPTAGSRGNSTWQDRFPEVPARPEPSGPSLGPSWSLQVS